MKNTLFLALCLIFATACSQGQKTSAEFSVTIAGLAAPVGGMIVTGKRVEGGAFSRVMTDSILNLDLPNGTWNFLVMMWDGGTPFAGRVRCDFKKAIALSGDAVALNFSVTNAACSSTEIITTGSWDAAATPYPNFRQTDLRVCRLPLNDAISTNAPCTFDSTNPQSGLASIASVKLIMPSGNLVKGVFIPSSTTTLTTDICHEVSSLGTLPRLPAIRTDTFHNPLVVRGFFKSGCNGAVISRTNENGGLGYFYDTGSFTKFFTSFTDAEICAEADRLNLNNLDDIGVGTITHPFGLCRLKQLHDWQQQFDAKTAYRTGSVQLLRNQNLLPGVKVRNAIVSPNAFSQCLGDGSTFMPIGLSANGACAISGTNSYGGTLHGLEKTIEHFRFRQPEGAALNAIGFIRYLSGKVVYLTLNKAEIESESNVGALVGQLSSSGQLHYIKIYDSYIEARGETLTGRAGGIVAWMTSSAASTNLHVYNTEVEGKNFVGGIAGESASVNLTDVSFSGRVYGFDGVGGISGTGGNITRAISSGLIEGETNVGGIAGTAINIDFARSTASVISRFTSSPVKLGGLVGDGTGVTNSFFAGSYTHQCLAGASCLVGALAGEATTTDQTWASSPSVGFGGVNGNGSGSVVHGTTVIETDICPGSLCTDPATQWNFYSGTVPRLAFEQSDCMNSTNTNSLVAQKALGRGTQVNPLLICNYGQFASIGTLTDHIRLADDIPIDASDMFYTRQINLSAKINGNGFRIFGAHETAGSFRLFSSITSVGSITNLKVQDFVMGTSVDTNIAALTNTSAGTLHNLRLDAIRVEADSQSAGLVVTNSGSISNIRINGQIISDGGNVGGLVYNNTGTIQNVIVRTDISYSSANSSYNASVGGIAAINNGTISRATYEGKMNLAGGAGNAVYAFGIGGIAGTNYGPITDVHVSDDSEIRVSTLSGVIAGGFVGVQNSTGSVVRGVNNGIIMSPLGVSASSSLKARIGSNSGTMTTALASMRALNYVDYGSLITATSDGDNNGTCELATGFGFPAADGNYRFIFSGEDRYYSATTSSSGDTLSYVSQGDSCVPASTSYTAFSEISEPIVAPIPANMGAFSLTNAETNAGATTMKDAYVAYITGTSTTPPTTWIFEEGEAKLFRFDD